jgi:hypothetical protein
MARMREHYAAADAIEQLDTITPFQRSNRRAGGRLREMQLAGGLGDMLLVGHRGEDSELFKRHGEIILQV